MSYKVGRNKNTRTFEICGLDYNCNGRNNYKLVVNMTYNNGEYSSSVEVWQPNKKDIVMGGQCFNSLIEEFPKLKENELFMELYDLWDKYHLNFLHAGTPEQEEAIQKWKEEGNEYDYKEACEYLKLIGLYEVPISTIDIKNNPSFEGKEGMYKYGHAWLKEEIPEADVKRIENLLDFGEILKETENIIEMEYDDYEL